MINIIDKANETTETVLQGTPVFTEESKSFGIGEDFIVSLMLLALPY